MSGNLVTYSKKIKLIKNCPQEQMESISKSLYKLQRLRHRPHQDKPMDQFKNKTSRDVFDNKLNLLSKDGHSAI